MSKEETNKVFDSFAWLIARRVEEYVNENEAAYQAWVQANVNQKSGTDESDRENDERGIKKP